MHYLVTKTSMNMYGLSENRSLTIIKVRVTTKPSDMTKTRNTGRGQNRRINFDCKGRQFYCKCYAGTIKQINSGTTGVILWGPLNCPQQRSDYHLTMTML